MIKFLLRLSIIIVIPLTIILSIPVWIVTQVFLPEWILEWYEYHLK